MRETVILLFVLVAPTILFGQNDSIQNKKNEICFGTSMFPFLYNDINYGFGIGKELIETPSLRTRIIGYNVFPPLNFSYKNRINNKYKIRIGFTFTKVPDLYDHGTIHYLGQIGVQRNLNKVNKKVETSFCLDLLAVNLQFDNYYETGGNNNIGKIENGNIFLGGIDFGYSFQYSFAKRFFIESDVTLMAYYGIGNGFVYDSSYPEKKRPIDYYTYGIVFEKLLGLNIGYNF